MAGFSYFGAKHISQGFGAALDLCGGVTHWHDAERWNKIYRAFEVAATWVTVGSFVSLGFSGAAVLSNPVFWTAGLIAAGFFVAANIAGEKCYQMESDLAGSSGFEDLEVTRRSALVYRAPLQSLFT